LHLKHCFGTSNILAMESRVAILTTTLWTKLKSFETPNLYKVHSNGLLQENEPISPWFAQKHQSYTQQKIYLPSIRIETNLSPISTSKRPPWINKMFSITLWKVTLLMTLSMFMMWISILQWGWLHLHKI
jgi:hypothetical protein